LRGGLHPRGRRRKKIYKTFQMGGSLAKQEEEQGGPQPRGMLCTVPKVSQGAAWWARPEELPALGCRGLLGSHGPKKPEKTILNKKPIKTTNNPK
jgi:hypothetical protein